MRSLLAVGLLAAAGHASAQAFVRAIPDEAQRARITHVAGSNVLLDGREVALAPGAQLRGADNLMTVPSALPRDALVRYTLDFQGNIQRVWVLTAEEIGRRDPPVRR